MDEGTQEEQAPLERFMTFREQPEEEEDSDMMQLLESIPFDDILSAMIQETETEDDRLLTDRGYIIDEEITNTLQGTLLKGKRFSLSSDGTRSTQIVAIKRISRELHDQRVYIEDGFSFVVDEDITSEARILRDLQTIGNADCAVDGTLNGCYQHLVHFVDFFSSTKYHYLITQWIDSPMTLQTFIRRAWRYIDTKQLSKVEYHRTIQSLIWQLVRTVHWLHTVCHGMKC